MKLYPESAAVQLEFDKVKALLVEYCRTEYAKAKSDVLRIHTKKEFIDLDLNQTHEFKLMLEQSVYFPSDFTQNISKDIKLLGIPGATLAGEQFIQIRKLAENIASIFRWFDNYRKIGFPSITKVNAGNYN